jgi:hypothetical protein
LTVDLHFIKRLISELKRSSFLLKSELGVTESLGCVQYCNTHVALLPLLLLLLLDEAPDGRCNIVRWSPRSSREVAHGSCATSCWQLQSRDAGQQVRCADGACN